MEITSDMIFSIIGKGGVLAFAALVYVQILAFGKELRKHREEETETRKELIGIGKAVAMLLERDRDRAVADFVREEISGVHDAAESDTPVEMPPRKKRAQSPLVIVRKGRDSDKEKP